VLDEARQERRRARRRLLAFLKKGGVIEREQFGGVVGEQWRRATRSGPGFDADICARLLEKGCIVGGKPHFLRTPGADCRNTFILEPAE
jgi:hypothetical protein